MAIKGKKITETISIYDPALGAYREVALEDYRKQLESLGLTEKEIEKKIKEFQKGREEELKKLGVK